MRTIKFLIISFFILAIIPSTVYSESSSDSAIYAYKIFQDYYVEGQDSVININFKVLEITNSPNPEAIDKINQIIRSEVSEDILSFQQYFEELVKEYISTMEANPDMPRGGWSVERTNSVEYNNHGILSLGIHCYDFTGGAHPSHWTLYFNFNLYTGDTLTLSDIFTERALTDLNLLGEDKFREMYSIPLDENINDHGFWFEDDRFSLNNNFYLTPEGLYFLYNPYEIACYASGYTTLEFKWDEIKDFVKRTSIVYSIF